MEDFYAISGRAAMEAFVPELCDLDAAFNSGYAL
jgi:hypothetical protein